MTGVDFSNIIDLKIDKGYSAFLTPVEKNNIVKEATVSVIESIYQTLYNQDSRDKLSFFIKTNTVVSPVNNSIGTSSTFAPFLANYNHVLAIKAKYSELLTKVSVTGATNASPIVITVSSQNNLRTGENINISDVLGNMSANGDFFIKKISNTKFSLYSDSALLKPVSGNGTYVSGGSISRIFYEYATPVISDRKIDVYSQASFRYPKYEITNNLIRIYPLTLPCVEASVDYLAVPATYINVLDNTIDLENEYPIDLLYLIADKSANLFAQAFKDGDLFNTSNFEQAQNS